ncbi:MAG TPA: family 1 glycosylhydrolase [Bacillales bacterium]|nr:family 1 glycosylhydrolase [Bacillales bacterium]
MEKDFVWAVGIEDTFVTQVEHGERALDEYELTQHYQNWRSDLDKARQSGATMIRYGIPWYKIEPEEGRFDWEWTDQVMDYFREHKGLTPIIDLMHYGTPHWLKNEFANGLYPECVARYAARFAERYKDIVTYYTPLNEPYVNAEFCGLNAVWPPYLEGLGGFYRILTQVGKGIINTVHAIQSVQEEAQFVHVDATKKYFTHDPLLQNEVDLWNENRFAMWELVSGKITKVHPLRTLMSQYGVGEETFSWFENNGIGFDIVGINYYPQFSVHEVKRDAKGYVIYPHVMGTEEDMADIIREASRRYRSPVMITETSFRGSENERIDWLNRCHRKCEELRTAEKIELTGLTWFPFLDLVDWGYRTSGKSVEEEVLPFGLYTLKMEDGRLKRKKNRVCDRFEELAGKKDGRRRNG